MLEDLGFWVVYVGLLALAVAVPAASVYTVWARLVAQLPH